MWFIDACSISREGVILCRKTHILWNIQVPNPAVLVIPRLVYAPGYQTWSFWSHSAIYTRVSNVVVHVIARVFYSGTKHACFGHTRVYYIRVPLKSIYIRIYPSEHTLAAFISARGVERTLAAAAAAADMLLLICCC